MVISKTQTKTILTVSTSIAELRANLTAYQSDMMQEMVAELYRNEDGKTVNWRDAAKFALICMNNSEEFEALVEKTGTPWIPTPSMGSTKAWVDLVINHPYMFGLTDEVVTEDIQEVVLIVSGNRYTATGLKENI